MKHYVFYAGMLYGEYDWTVISRNQLSCLLAETPEIYNGCYIYGMPLPRSCPAGWWRADGTPVLLEDVPKELLLLKLLLT